MEGAQHNTMDVEYYGPNPEMGFWYLGALRAAEEMARAVGDDAFAAECRDLFDRGSAWLDANLFDGEYYEGTLPLERFSLRDGGEQAFDAGHTLSAGTTEEFQVATA